MITEQINLTIEADDYLRTLPGLIYPQALVNQFARIANRIVDHRFDEPALQNYFESLINDKRGGRRGFPPEVMQDILQLRDAMVGGILTTSLPPLYCAESASAA